MSMYDPLLPQSLPGRRMLSARFLDPATSRAQCIFLFVTGLAKCIFPWLGIILVFILSFGSSFAASESRNPDSQSGVIWKIPFEGSWSAPVVQDLLYVGGGDGAVYAFDPSSGELRWRFQTGEDLPSGPRVITVSPDADLSEMMAAAEKAPPRGIKSVDATPVISGERLFIVSRDTTLYSLERATGDLIWSYGGLPKGFRGDIKVHGGMVYAVSVREEKLYAIDSDTGEGRWSFDGRLSWEPPLVTDDTVYATGEDKKEHSKSRLYAIDRVSGELSWSLAVPGAHPTRATIAKDLIFFTTDKDWFGKNTVEIMDRRRKGKEPDHVTLYAVDLNSHRVKWEHQLPRTGLSAVWRFPASVWGGLVFFFSNQNLVALETQTGRRAWMFEPRKFDLTELLVEGQTVYAVTAKHPKLFGRGKATVYALDAQTGEEKWTYSTGGVHFLTPMLLSRGEPPRLYLATRVADDKFRFQAINPEDGAALWSFKSRTPCSEPHVGDGRFFVSCATRRYWGMDKMIQGYLYSIDEATRVESRN